MEVMHPAFAASSKNKLRSTFEQFLAASTENKERSVAIRPDQSVRDSDRIRSSAMVDSLERKRAGTGTHAEEKG